MVGGDMLLEHVAAFCIFAVWLLKSAHRIVILKESDFTRKLNDIRCDFDYHPMSGVYLKLIFSQAFMNPERCRIIDVSPALSLETEAILQRPSGPPLSNVECNRYLFESAITTEEKIIVTTDTKLMKHFEGNEHFKLMRADAFFLQFEI